jgi:ankyrin repeat protein
MRHSSKWIFLLLVALGVSAAAAEDDARLVAAARARDRAMVRTLLQQGVPVNARLEDGATALHWAAHWDDIEVADALIAAGADVNVANELGATPLQLACINGSAAMINRLLARGARANDAGTMTGATPLMTCARSGSLEAVRGLLLHGAQPDAAETFKGQTALMWAVAENHPHVVRALLEGGANVRARSKGGFTAMLFAAQQGNLESAEILLAAGGDVNEPGPDGITPLLVAVESGHASIASFLLEKGAHVDASTAGRTALHAAVQAARPDIAAELLGRGANPNARLTRRLPRVAGELAGGPVSMIGATPFWLAAKFADSRMMRLLVEKGADPLVPSNDGTTPLMVAAGIGWVDGQDRYGNLLFESDRAKREQADLDAVTYTLAHGGDVNAVNQHGQTAMHGAAYMGSDAVVRLLAQHGAKLDVADKYGQTPLVIAEGIYVGGAFVASKSTAAQLRTLGAGRKSP